MVQNMLLIIVLNFKGGRWRQGGTAFHIVGTMSNTDTAQYGGHTALVFTHFLDKL